MGNNDQKGGATWEMNEEKRRENQEQATAWELRQKDEIITADDMRLWKERKQRKERT